MNKIMQEIYKEMNRQKLSVAFFVIIFLVVVFFVFSFFDNGFVISIKAYLAKPITEMSIGEFLFSIWFISALFSDRSK